jgi:hypothetical protein
MTPVLAKSPVVTGTSLINAACRKYQEAVHKFRRVEAAGQTLPTQEAVARVSEIQGILRETRQLLDQGISQMPDMNSPECEGAIGKNTRDQTSECPEHLRLG